MAKKSKKSTAPTKKQIALSRRQRQFQRRVYIGLAALIALVLGILGIGAYQEFVVKPATPIATVNGQPIGLGVYEKRVRYRRWELDRNAAIVQAQLSQLDSASAENEFLVSYYQQMLSQLNSQRIQVGYQVVEELIRETLVRQKAAAENLTVSSGDVTQEINRLIAGNFGAMTAIDATATIAAGPEATATALTFTPTPVPTPTPTLTATLAITTPTPISPTATPAPTPTPYILSDQELGQQRQQFFQALNQGTGWSEADYREIIRTSLLADKLQEFFADNASTTAEQVHAAHILLADEEEARKALARVQEGEDFAAVAVELSEDEETKEEGGDLGWFPADTFRLPSAVVEAAFALQPGQVVTDVVPSYYGGYHVVQVLERDPDRPLAEDDLQAHKQQAFGKWLQEQLEDPDLIVNMWSPDMIPAEES
jgi:parvulin-like peptidyl-prolyl isomerase